MEITGKLIRVHRCHADELAAALRDAGFTATIESWVPSTWGDGCGDPGHCTQHPDAVVSWVGDGWGMADMPASWCGIRTSCSGRKAHKIWVTKGLVA